MYNHGRSHRSNTMKIMIGIIPSHRWQKKPLRLLQNFSTRNNTTRRRPLSCLEDAEATALSNFAASSNQPPTSYGVSSSSSSSLSSSSSSWSSSTTTRSSQEDQSSAIEGEQVSGVVSTEEQNMRKPPNTTISHGVISVIGRRRSMEDAVTIALDLVQVAKHHQKKLPDHELMSYDLFAVYDGHGSHRVVQRCKERLHHVVAEQLLDTGRVDQWESVMVSSFARMDDEIAKEDGVRSPAATEESEGTTALVVLVGKEEIVVANCGDSRVVLFCDGAAFPLSHDGKPEGRDEKERVGAAEGDEYLKPYVISSPEVTVHKRSVSEYFQVIASDGLWDVVSSETACDLVRKCCSGEFSRTLTEGATGNCASASAAMLVELALARGSKDNISVIVVELEQLRTNGGSSST